MQYILIEKKQHDLFTQIRQLIWSLPALPLPARSHVVTDRLQIKSKGNEIN